MSGEDSDGRLRRPVESDGEADDIGFLPPGRTGRRVRYLFGASWLLMAAALAATQGPSVSPRYYELVAQILPVFWVVLAIDRRVYRATRSLGQDRFIVIANYVTLVLGEVAAVVAVAADERSNSLLLLLTVVALAQALFAMSSLALEDEPPQRPEPRAPIRPS